MEEIELVKLQAAAVAGGMMPKSVLGAPAGDIAAGAVKVVRAINDYVDAHWDTIRSRSAQPSLTRTAPRGANSYFPDD